MNNGVPRPALSITSSPPAKGAAPRIGAVFRGLAVVIAVAAFVDPAIRTSSRTRPEIAVIAAGASFDSLAARTAEHLQRQFTVLRAPWPGAGATVVVGEQLPASLEARAPVFVVRPDAAPVLRLAAVRAPRHAQLDARMPVTVDLHVTNAAGHDIELELQAGGLAVDRVVTPVTGSDERATVSLAFVPATTGPAPIRVVARTRGAAEAAADLLVDVRDRRWSVLFYDPRPSWSSTFVRRALERDPRFLVTSRVITSRNVSTAAGEPPGSLTRLTALEPYDAVVIGAPEQLSSADIDGIAAYLRRRAGSVVLLFDQTRTDGTTALTGAISWRTAVRTAAVGVGAAPTDTTRLQARALLWPATLPPGARVIAATQDSAALPLIWRKSLGAGTLIVSGALDAWQRRSAAGADFNAFWTSLIAGAAAASPPPIDVRIEQPVLRPGARTTVTVRLRDLAYAPPATGVHSASVSAWIEGPGGRTEVRLWPGTAIGELQAGLRAPSAAGAYRLRVTANGESGDASLVVSPDARPPAHSAIDLLDAWTTASGGRVVPASQLGALPGLLTAAVQPELQAALRHPMRSAWWILPFAFLLAVDWFLRRRRGLP